MLVDTHSHLYLNEFAADLEQVMQRSMDTGVSHIFLPNIDSASIPRMLQLETHFPDNCHAMMGLHPCSIKENMEEELQQMESWLDKRPFSAIGEIGLDFYHDRKFTNQQIDAFERQIDWAIRYGIPISIHSRNATRECIDIIGKRQNGSLKGVFHCFSGTIEESREITELGFHLGIGGVVTFKNAGLDKVISNIDLKHIVLETDSPYLAPVPYRGKRNESSYLPLIAAKIAAINNVPVSQVESITTANAMYLFGKSIEKQTANIPVT